MPAFGYCSVSSVPAVSAPLLRLLVLFLIFDRASISAESSVADDGSPGSSIAFEESSPSPFDSPALDRVRARLDGGTWVSLDERCFLCRVLDEGDSASSSPEASRDDGWSRSAVDDLS